MKKINLNMLAWIILILFTAVWGGITFLGPETHSEIHEAPTVLSKIRDLLIFFFIFGGIILPIKNAHSVRLNLFVVATALLVLIVKSLQLVYNLIWGAGYGDLRFLVLLILILIFVFVLFLLKLKLGKKLIKAKVHSL